MLKEVVFTSIFFAFISGCALMETSDIEVEKESAAAPAANPQPEPTINQTPVATPLTETVSGSDGNKNVSSEDIKRIQTHLKNTGFYSGSVDGIFGPSSQSAIRHFQSGCATLKDLVTSSDPEAIQQSSGIPAKVAMTKSKRGTPEAVRLIQLRLKDAGFNPGPIDGIYGAKTEGALRALNSGCLMLRGLSPVSTSEATASVRRENSAATISEHPDGQLGSASSREVRSLQIRLRDAGFNPGPIDGVLGPRTRSALQNYQASLAGVSALR
jgi:peptidoglycan hydrolase-like protein with peptidoglycan-binding domain